MSRITNRSCQARAFKPTVSSSDTARTLAAGVMPVQAHREAGVMSCRSHSRRACGPSSRRNRGHMLTSDPRCTSRGSLVRILSADRGHELTLLDAPAGWGKTTLLGQWITKERERREVAWLSLDPADNDPARFWAYVVAALQKACPRLSTHAARLLAYTPTPSRSFCLRSSTI